MLSELMCCEGPFEVGEQKLSPEIAMLLDLALGVNRDPVQRIFTSMQEFALYKGIIRIKSKVKNTNN